jgi:hypothetical protein
MACIGEQRSRVHNPPSNAFHARKDNIYTQPNKRDASAPVTFTESKEGMSEVRPLPETTDGAHLRFAKSRSTRLRGRGHGHANVSVLRRSHESASESWRVHGHDGHIFRPP